MNAARPADARARALAAVPRPSDRPAAPPSGVTVASSRAASTSPSNARPRPEAILQKLPTAPLTPPRPAPRQAPAVAARPASSSSYDEDTLLEITSVETLLPEPPSTAVPADEVAEVDARRGSSSGAAFAPRALVLPRAVGFFIVYASQLLITLAARLPAAARATRTRLGAEWRRARARAER